jgi:hypothetical protein
MKRRTIIAVVSVVVSLFLLSLPHFADAQGISYGGGTTSGAVIVTGDGFAMNLKAKVEINREPIPILQLATELVEILPGETRVLTSNAGEYKANSSIYPGFPALRAGSAGGGFMGIKAGVPISYNFKVVRLDQDGLALDITITDNSNKILAARTLSLQNYEEGMIEFASTENGDKKLAVRFLPTIKAIPPVQDFPALLRSFTLSGLLIRNGDELLSRGTVITSTFDDLVGKKMPFFTFNSQRTGFLVMSYRPFPGAVVAGYFEDKKLIFEWNGDTYEYLSMDKPFLPEGRWAAYFWQAAPAFPASDKGISVGGFEADPDELQAKVNQVIEMRKGASTIKIGPILQSK